MMWWGDGGWGAGRWVAMSVMMLLFWGLLAAAVYWVVRTARPERGHNPPPASPTASADQLLAERFARGEITADDYTQWRAVLHAAAPSSVVTLRKGS